MTIVLHLHSMGHHGWLNLAMIAIAKYGLAVTALLLLAGWFRKPFADLLLWMAGGAIAAMLLAFIAGHMIYHERPFVQLGITPLIAHSRDNGFPSDHAIVAAYAATMLWFVDVPLAIVATVTALAIGLARVYCLVHWPYDVIGGWVIGAVSALIALLMVRRYRRSIP